MIDALAFLRSLASVPRKDREDEILAARDLWVDWPLCEVRIGRGGRDVRVQVTSDVFALGDPDAPIRVPLSAHGAQRVADALGMHLVTPRISDAVWACAEVSIAPQPMAPPVYPYDASMMSVERFIIHNGWIEERRAGRHGLAAGHKKDVVLSAQVAQRPAQVAIYGWHERDGRAVQPLSLVHESTYADYAHGVRLVAPEVTIDGVSHDYEDLLRDPELAHLLSSEGPLAVSRYSTTWGHAAGGGV